MKSKFLGCRAFGFRGGSSRARIWSATVILWGALVGGPESFAATSAVASGLTPKTLPGRYYDLVGSFVDGTTLGETIPALQALFLEAFRDPTLKRQFRLLQGSFVDFLDTNCGPDCLVPIWFLYQDLTHSLARSGHDVPARLSLGTLEEIEKRYLGSLSAARVGDGREVASRLLTRMALALRRDRRFDQSLEYFNRALAQDPKLAVALRSAAALEEKRADYEAAERRLSRLLSLRPNESEAELRRALCRLRRGRDKQALETLRQMTAGGGPAAEPWVEAVAFQEQIRLLILRGDTTGAQELLATARERHPFDQALALQESQLFPQPATKGRELVEAAVGWSSSEASWGIDQRRAPRQVYNRWPAAGLAELEVQLNEDLQRHRPAARSADRSVGGTLVSP